MNPTLNAAQLEVIHAALITRQRIVREDYIPVYPEGSVRREELVRELAMIESIIPQVVYAQLSQQMGFVISPPVAA